MSIFTDPSGLPLFDPGSAFLDTDEGGARRRKERVRQLRVEADKREAQTPDDITGMVRSEDHATSIAAAKILVRGVTDLQRRIVSSFKQFGPMTDEELERLPEYSEYGPTTVHKRRTELYQAGKVEQHSVKRNSRGKKMIVWQLSREGREL